MPTVVTLKFPLCFEKHKINLNKKTHVLIIFYYAKTWNFTPCKQKKVELLNIKQFTTNWTQNYKYAQWIFEKQLKGFVRWLALTHRIYTYFLLINFKCWFMWINLGQMTNWSLFYKSKYCVWAPIKIHKDYLLYVIAFYIASYKKLEVNESESFSTL